MKIFSCLEDRVLVRVKKQIEPETTASGIIKVGPKEVEEATVFSVGMGRYAGETGALIPTFTSRGDIVLIGKGAGLAIDIELEDGSTEEMKLIRESDILILVSKKESTN